jgi:hypothetical protein
MQGYKSSLISKTTSGPRAKTRLDSQLPTGPRLRYYYYTGTFTSGELQVEYGAPTFTMREVFIGVNWTSIDLERLVWGQVVAGRPGGAASTDFLHRLRLLLLV